ncbi:MAG: hypothetical protein IKR78_00695 [Dehalococcoidales bacterium]|nr:hypothetical protein [Dehalococcoidales bacterium]
MAGKVYLIGLGPGTKECITSQSLAAVDACSVIISPPDALPILEKELQGKVLITEKMSPIARSKRAIEMAENGTVVGILSVGHPGFYAIATTFLDVLGDNELDIEVIPGMTMLDYASAKMGSPLGRDYSVISLTDQASPWDEIRSRAESAIDADMVTVIYNPIGKLGDGRLHEIVDYARNIRNSVVGLLICIEFGKEKIVITDVENFPFEEMTEATLVIIGNSYTKKIGNRMLTPRPYAEGKGY